MAGPQIIIQQPSWERATKEDDTPLLAVEGLDVVFPRRDGVTYAVRHASFSLRPGTTLGIVGESGSGKSMSALATMGLLPPPGRIEAGSIRFDGQDLTALSTRRMARLRGDRLAMIFQEPMTALNPVQTIGDQIAETLLLHRGRSRAEALEITENMLARVGIPAPRQRARNFPHQLSGGMRQRAMIAMALICHPALLIADEPTTALDVTVQAQILDLLMEMQSELGMAIQFISHNLAVISEIADHVAVMYAGRIVETAPADALFDEPLHPYTRMLLAAVPVVGARDQAGAKGRMKRLGDAIGLGGAQAGQGGGAAALGDGGGCCRFFGRCPLAAPLCREEDPPLVEIGHRAVACPKVLTT